jgi:membrane protease subunit HflC
MDSRHDPGLEGLPFPGELALPDSAGRRRRWRIAAAGSVLACVWLALSVVNVGVGEAVLVTHFGSPARVLTRPGLYLTWPAPAGAVLAVDTRLRTTLGEVREVTTRDGRHLEMQAFAAWRVPAEAEPVKLFLRAGAATAARGMGGLLTNAMPAAANDFDFADLLNGDAHRLRLDALADKVKETLAGQAHDAFGVTVLQIGIVRLSLPKATLMATEAHMRAQLEAEAALRTAQAQSQAAEIRAEASRDSRIALADAQTEAAQIEAASRKDAADIQAKAYNADPDLYLMLRSLDTLSTMVGPSTRLVLRTDAAPFNMLVQGPPTEAGK